MTEKVEVVTGRDGQVMGMHPEVGDRGLAGERLWKVEPGRAGACAKGMVGVGEPHRDGKVPSPEAPRRSLVPGL